MRNVPVLALVFASLAIATAQQNDHPAAINAQSNADALRRTPSVRTMRLPVGFRYEELVLGKLKGKLDSRTATVGEPVRVRIWETGYGPDGSVVVPEGTVLVGKVVAVTRQSAANEPSTLEISLDHAVCNKHAPPVEIHALLYPVLHPPTVNRGPSLPYSGGTVDWIMQRDPPPPGSGFFFPVMPNRSGGYSTHFGESYIPEDSGIKGIWLKNDPTRAGSGIYLVPKGHVRLEAGTPMNIGIHLASPLECP